MRKNIEEIMVNPDIAIKEVVKKINVVPKLGLPSGIALIIKAAIEGYSRNKLSFPGFVGGYCLKKDPYIYTNVAEEFNVISNLAIASREINIKIAFYHE